MMIRVIESTDAGAPQIDGTQGIVSSQFLDAAIKFLVTGFGNTAPLGWTLEYDSPPNFLSPTSVGRVTFFRNTGSNSVFRFSATIQDQTGISSKIYSRAITNTLDPEYESAGFPPYPWFIRIAPNTSGPVRWTVIGTSRWFWFLHRGIGPDFIWSAAFFGDIDSYLPTNFMLSNLTSGPAPWKNGIIFGPDRLLRLTSPAAFRNFSVESIVDPNQNGQSDLQVLVIRTSPEGLLPGAYAQAVLASEPLPNVSSGFLSGRSLNPDASLVSPRPEINPPQGQHFLNVYPSEGLDLHPFHVATATQILGKIPAVFHSHNVRYFLRNEDEIVSAGRRYRCLRSSLFGPFSVFQISGPSV
jgi:hypothetical protein